jgi:predicted DNA-binding protein
MKNNEIRKSIKITKELNEMLQEAVKIIGTTETSVIKVALFEYLKGLK